MPRVLDPHVLALMRAIKAQFDPDGIPNPEKLLPKSSGSFEPPDTAVSGV